MLNDDLGLLGQVHIVEGDETGQSPAGLISVVCGIIQDGLFELEILVVGEIVGQHVFDEALPRWLDASGTMKRMMLSVSTQFTEQFQCSTLRVAVNAKNDRFGCRPRAATASANNVSASMASSTTPTAAEPKTRRSSLAASPVCDEWASSTITA